MRFASVYRQFRDVGQFKREVDELQKREHAEPDRLDKDVKAKAK